MKKAMDAVVSAQGFSDRVQQYELNRKVKVSSLPGKKQCIVRHKTTDDIFELTSISMSEHSDTVDTLQCELKVMQRTESLNPPGLSKHLVDVIEINNHIIYITMSRGNFLLSDLLHKRPSDRKEIYTAVNIVRKLAIRIQELHKENIVLRQLNPSSISLSCKSGRPNIFKFSRINAFHFSRFLKPKQQIQ